MVRGNCDYIFLQPIYNKTQRDTIWDLEVIYLNLFTMTRDIAISGGASSPNCIERKS